MSNISTHVIDTTAGTPAEGIAVVLEYLSGSSWEQVASDSTNSDGRVEALLEAGELVAGTYRLTFATAAYSDATDAFYPSISVTFSVTNPASHHHVPLLLSPYGYSTYRGS